MKANCAVLVLVAIIALQGCSKDPVKIESSSNANVPVGLLFEHDGCKIYRFDDGGRSIYFAKCREPSQTAWQTTTLAGKAVITTDHRVSTEIVR